MIYLEQTIEPQQVRIPRNLLPLPEGEYVVTLQNTIDRSRVSVTPSQVTAAALYYVVNLELPDLLPAGEYSYELRKGSAVLAVGILTLGEYRYETTQYQAGATYTQYEG